METTKYKGKNILAGLSYNQNYLNANGANTRCYIYPLILMTENTCEHIDPEDFPKYGSIEVRIQGGESAEDVYSNCGSLVQIKINADLIRNSEAKNEYSLKYNSQYGKDRSEIWIEPFSGKGFNQIIESNRTIEEIQKERSIEEPDYSIYTTHILIKCGDKLYGPFEFDIKEGRITLRGIQKYQYNIGEYNEKDYTKILLPTEEGEESIEIISETLLPSPETCKNRQDWISETVLIDSFINVLRVNNNYSRSDVRQIKKMVHQLAESDLGVQFTNERMSKIESLIQKINQKEEFVTGITQYALQNEDTKKILAKEIIKEYWEQIKDCIPELDSVKTQINDLKIEEENLKRRVSDLKEEEESLKRNAEKRQKVEKTIAQDILKKNQNEISELTKKLEEEKKERERLKEEISLHKEIKDLEEERDHWKSELDKAKENYDQQLIDNKGLEDKLEDILESFNDRATQTAKILDSKLLDKILRRIGEEPDMETVKSFEVSLLHAEPMDATDIIKRVTDFISEKAHRDVTFNDVTNYLICITQGFITTFAGEPGSGKTSLCNILAKALGLVVADVSQRRFVDVSVERGWSSHKDFIGYYNPLSKKMERSNGAVFSAFERMDCECDCDQSKIAPFIILLDEANLSPIEHYWAAFLRNCDFTSVSNRSISLGGIKNFRLPEHLRFLATVNFDHTTEELSPRFLDRSWVIMLEPTSVEDEFDEDIENAEDMIPFGALKNAFSVGEDSVIDEAIKNKWNTIQKIFKDRALPIMPRNLKMVRNYCSVACKYMEHDTPATKFAPLDYALSQKILPTINGSGENYRCLIEELIKECTPQNMPISAKHLERIKRVSETNMGFFQFFSR